MMGYNTMTDRAPTDICHQSSVTDPQS